MREMRLAILFSGNGSNLENVYRKMQNLIIDSAESQNLGGNISSLRADSQNLRGNPQGFARAVARSNHPPIKKTQDLQSGLPRSHSLARNDEFLDSADLAKIKLNFALAISSKESAFGITRCNNLGLKCEVIDYKKNKENFFSKLMQILRDGQIDLVVLAGFMRILPPTFTAKFRAINIHPSILPLFKGANAIRESFESDMKIAGVSVHFVSDELDSGALIAQDIIHKIEGESVESFEARIHELEYKLYPKAIIKAIKIVGNSQNIGKNNPSLRDSAKQNRGNPPIEKSVELQNGLPRSHLLARNDEILDSSLRKCSAQNDKIDADNDKNSVRVAESALDSANSKHKTPNL